MKYFAAATLAAAVQAQTLEVMKINYNGSS
jgi:hypothetical protein